jgi:predicted dehydrogenase
MDNDDAGAKRRRAAPPPKQIVVLGAGMWVRERYAPALEPYRAAGKCGVFVLYDTSYAKRDAQLSAEVQASYNAVTWENVRCFEQWGATCMDLADPKVGEKVKGIAPHTVFVVTPDDTHCDMVEAWADRASNIIVEKPFDVDPERIRHLRSHIDGTDCAVRGFDHYLVRANQFATVSESLGVDAYLQETVRSFTFHMLESEDRGMAERHVSLQGGLLLDMAIHGQAMLLPFGDPNTIRLDSVRAAVYEANPGKGITTSGRELLRSGRETFAEVRFGFTSKYGYSAEGVVRVGKCVGDQDEKYVEVVGGENGDRRIRLDMTSCIVDRYGGKEEGPFTSLFRNPVHLLVREVLEGRSATSLSLFPPEKAQDMVARVNEWRLPIGAFLERGGTLASYPAKAPLNEILDRATGL